MPPDGDLPVLTLQPDAAVVIRRTDRPLLTPAALERALASARDQFLRRHVEGLYLTVELTAIGWTGSAAETDCHYMLDDMAGVLAAQLRCQDLLARTGQYSFAVLAIAISEPDAETIYRRVSAAMETFVAEWRGRGIVTCCALNRETLGADSDVSDLAPRVRWRHTLLSPAPANGGVAA